ncbi:MAG: hypothetical protein COT71_02400 [Candidatus Andersenbacteria bacterium CG10_big_fil_rev_8_21_14_0_10_54_11]|uniref:Uncharacterized protein n=1 Tax=Candidatus Andersenbacteria bacterium CG10_big_fil_rev_8_21_14_0_10_54_11 TaxID=1974485 RepID=A0A2M6WZD6_9BACT|nr:MAG: hypothetical protein COT71_02400 [Candidatus Andersenbacteria bacterium CG10_big_fil_rev_8_21_14_0_10_54_11]
MIVKRFISKIHHLREQPEEVRLKAISRYTIVIGLIVASIWLAILLPLQVALKRQPAVAEQQQGQEKQSGGQAAQTTASPSPASLFAPSPSPAAQPQ